MRIGVWPLSTVDGPPVTGTKLPAAVSFWKYLTPGSMLLNDPPLASAAA